MNAEELLQTASARVLIVGRPGSGKTGSLVSLANAGFKLRVLAYDKVGNMAPLLRYTTPEARKNMDIVLLDDKPGVRNKNVEHVAPTAFIRGFELMDAWKYKNRKGEVIDLGRSKDWGPDTVVVLDSITAQGEAAKRRAGAILNRTHLNFTDKGWGIAMAEQEAFVSRLLNSDNQFHVVVMAHLKMIGPQDARQGDSDMAKKRKAEEAELITTRLYPTALGRQLPQNFSGLGWTAVLHAERKVRNGKERRVLNTTAGEELDLKIPALDLPSELPIEDGLLKVFEKLTGGSETWFNQPPVVATEE